jgi:hypothetical protein
LGLFLAHQYIEQLSESTKAAIFGNVGTMISFRIGSTDAEVMEKEFYPTFNKIDLINLPRYSMYLKMMIDGATSQPFSADTLPLTECHESLRNEVIAASKEAYTKSRKEIEEDIFERYVHEKNPNTLF